MNRSVFSAITSEGGLLPADFLEALTAPKTTIDGLNAQDYHLAEGERISDQINRSWNRLRGCWENFKKSVAAKAPGESTTTETRERWLLPLFQELGFGRLAHVRMVTAGDRTYEISHQWEHVPLHLVGTHVDLDRRNPGAIGASRGSPHSLLQQVLNASEKGVWGIVTNGIVMRLLRDNAALTRQAFVEFDLQAMFDGDLYAEFVMLWLICHQSRFEAQELGHPEKCWLERWREAADQTGLRALEHLRQGVEAAIQALGEGLYVHPENAVLREKLAAGRISTQSLYQQILRLVYRLIFLFVAEERGLLHLPDDSEDGRRARQRYASHYSVSRLRNLRLSRAGTPHPDLWKVFQLLTSKFGSDTDCAELALPPLGSFLWRMTDSTPDLNNCVVSNRYFLTAVHAMAFMQDGNVRRAVDYRHLGAEELGSVYEGLLELHVQVNPTAQTFTLATQAGNERKTSGSYYTPDSLVQCLLDSALEPVLAEACRTRESEQAVLNLKVCDPACGSGHFLIAAAHRIAHRLAAIRTGEDEPAPAALRQALRNVISRCIYGVDINPMAVELCKVTLWLEALEPGKPLSFLDHHIRSGNSLFGATQELIAKGVPDGAFEPVEDDDKKVCLALRKRNKEEREGQADMFYRMAAEPSAEYNSLDERRREIDGAPDDTLAEIVEKSEQFRRFIVSPEYQHVLNVADAWCAAFVWRKEANAPCDPITTDTINRLQADRNALTSTQSEEVKRLAVQYQFFHYHLEFPEVFAQGGFDLSLGNPPWERIQVEEKQFFASSNPIIAAARSKDRQKLIEALKVENPSLYLSWQEANRLGHCQSNFVKSSGVYPDSGKGNVNTFALFGELAAKRINPKGRAGLILPSGVITEASNEDLFRSWLEKRQIVLGLDFENSSGMFNDVHRSFRFCLLTLCGMNAGPQRPSFCFSLTSVEESRDDKKLIPLGKEELQLLNPSSLTCPPIRSRRDAELLLNAHRRFGIFIGGELAAKNPWSADSKQMLNSSHDSESFVELAPEIVSRMDLRGLVSQESRTLLRLYDGKMVDQFDHRLASTGHNLATLFRTTSSERTADEDYARPDFLVTPQYWVALSKVSSLVPEQCRTRGWWLAFRAVTASTNWRTVVAAVIPLCGQVHSLPALYCFLSASENAALLGCLNSLALDYCARLKLSGTHLSHFVFRQLPVPPPTIFTQDCTWSSGTQPTKDWLLPRILELSYTAWDLEAFAKDCGFSGPPFRWDEERRFLLRCELDAAFFHLYLGAKNEWQRYPAALVREFPTPRHAVDYIMDTFPIVKRKDEERFEGDYRTKRVILEIYDALEEATQTGKPYQSPLDPAPADPRCCHSPRN